MASADFHKIAFDDARARQASLIQMILFLDQQAMSLLRLYITLAIPAATAAVAGFAAPDSLIPKPAAFALFAAVVFLFLGCVFCFQTMRYAPVTLVGRGADFWAAVSRVYEKDLDKALSRYLSDLEKSQVADRQTNLNASTSLGHARICGAAAPLASIIVGGFALIVF